MNSLPSSLNLFANPILRRYRRSRLRPVRIAITIVMTLVVAAFFTAMFFLPLYYRTNLTIADAARAPFIPLLFLQAAILMLFGTGAVGSGILQEVDEGMVEYQRLTPLSPLTKVLGYLFGLPARQYVAFGVTAIFTAFCIVVGNIPLKAWGSVYLVFFSSVILYHLLGLVTGLIIKSRWRAGLISIGLVLLLNLVLPALAEFGFAIFSHLTIRPVVYAHISDLMPNMRGAFPSGRSPFVAGPDVPFFDFNIPHLGFALIVQGSLILTFIVMLVRRWSDEQSHLLGKAYAVGFLIWLQTLLLGNVLPLLDRGRILTGLLGNRTDLTREFRRVSGSVEAQVLGVVYGVITLLALVPIISCITPAEPAQMAVFRRRKKFGLRGMPWFSDGASAAPFVWVAAGASGAAWALVVHRMFTSEAFNAPGFPQSGWAIFIGVTLVAAALFHFVMEAYGRRAAWFTLFLAGFVPLFTSLILGSISNDLMDPARYIVGLSPLSAPWQPIQWLEQLAKTKVERPSPGAAADFGPFALFCAAHVFLCVVLFAKWRSRRNAREKRA